MKCNIPFDKRNNMSIQEFYKCIDPIELQNKIRSFRKLNFKQMETGEIFREIQNVLCVNDYFNYPINLRTVQSKTLFFRVRKLKGTSIPFANFKTVSDMWEPPKEIIKKMGRLNRPGESLLYTSFEDPIVAVREARIQDGDFYTLIKYAAKDQIKINVIGGEYDTERLFDNDRYSIVSFNLINDFLRDEFSRDVGEGTEYLYKISETISKAYFDLPPREVQDAWAYSSIIDKCKYNVCFRPDIAHDLLQLHGAVICKKESGKEIIPLFVAFPNKDNDEIEYFKMESNIQKEHFPEIVLIK